jgi:hypothetical protein
MKHRTAKTKNSTGGTITKGATFNRSGSKSKIQRLLRQHRKPMVVTRLNATTPAQRQRKTIVLSQPETNPEPSALYQPAEPELRLPASSADPGMLLLAKLADEEKKYASEEKRQTKKCEHGPR